MFNDLARAERTFAEHLAREVWEEAAGKDTGVLVRGIDRDGLMQIAPRLLTLDLDSLPTPLQDTAPVRHC